jgi:hypothetical protein
MLVVRKDQLESLGRSAADDFAAQLVEHIKRFAPRHSQAVGDEGVRATVDSGIERSRTYGFTKRGPVRFFVELMVMFGHRFDTDPLLPWAGGTLTNESIKDEMLRADILHEQMVEYVEEVAGPERRDMVDTLHRLSRANLDDHLFPGGDYDSAVRAMLNSADPKKCAYIGSELLSDLIARGKDEAQQRSIITPKGAALITVLFLEIGHGALDDPMYPWISQTLADETVKDADERVVQLKMKVKRYLDETIKNLDKQS